ncbi:hypothetical protein [Roseibium sp.]|uniref:hypothetical protein n=1 Tax=Roseibium sp. TaxID=1936156 RepID=UPI003A980FB3
MPAPPAPTTGRRPADTGRHMMQVTPVSFVDHRAAYSARNMMTVDAKRTATADDFTRASAGQPQAADIVYSKEQIAPETYAAMSALIGAAVQRPAYADAQMQGARYQAPRMSGSLVSVTA